MTVSTLTPIAPGTVPIIVHIEHTGGTTMLDIISRQYRARELYQVYKWRKEKPTTRFMQMPEAERARYKAIVGHLYYGFHRHVPHPTCYVTLLRDPVSRILSSYTYALRHKNFRRHERYVAGLVSWEEHLTNHPAGTRQITRIAGGDDTVIQVRRNPDVPPDILETAIANLEADFSFVGLQERYDESLLMMRHVLNWQQPIHYVRQNTAKKRLTLNDLSAHDRALVEKAAELETPLYEYAKKRFEAQIAAYLGDIERDLAQLRADNERYAASQARVARIKAPLRAVRRAIRRVVKR